MRFNGDPILLVSGALLATSVALFFAGVTPYPYGWLGLSAVVVFRLGYLKRKNSDKRDNFRA